MTFPDAVRLCFSKYVDFSGRARRSEFWYWALFYVIVQIVAGIIDAIISTSGNGIGLVQGLADLALLLPFLSVGSRRLHDVGQSAWWLLFLILPFIGVLVLIFAFWIRHGLIGLCCCRGNRATSSACTSAAFRFPSAKSTSPSRRTPPPPAER